MSLFAKVRLLDAPHFLDKEYDYGIPEHLSKEVKAGGFVTVPFGGNAILPNHPTLVLSHRVQKTVLYICVSFAVPYDS